MEKIEAELATIRGYFECTKKCVTQNAMIRSHITY